MNNMLLRSGLDFFRLEYNEKQNAFHFDNYTHKANTCGWVTICENLLDADCKRFYYLFDLSKPVKLATVKRKFRTFEYQELLSLAEDGEIIGSNKKGKKSELLTIYEPATI
jgi:hypothetical protein